MLALWIFLCSQWMVTPLTFAASPGTSPDASTPDALPGRLPALGGLVLAGPDRPYQATVTGPARIRVVSRTVMIDNLRHYDIPVLLNGKLEAVFRYRTYTDKDHSPAAGDFRIGNRRVGYLSLPSGKHEILVQPAGAAYVQVLHRPMLFPNLNNYDDSDTGKSDWAHRVPLLKDAGEDWVYIAGLIGDPLVREGQLTAGAALTVLGQEDPALARWADELKRYASYTTVYPYDLRGPGRMDQRGFITPHEDNADFNYYLPSDGVPKPARLTVDLGDLASATFSVVINAAPAQSFEVQRPEAGSEARLDFALPWNTDMVRIRQMTGDQPLPIKFQVGGSPGFHLQDPEFAFYRSRLGMGLDPWFQDYLASKAFPTEDAMEDLARRSLARHFHPLKRLLSDSESETPSQPGWVTSTSGSALSAKDAASLRRRAQAEKDPVAAAALWVRVARNGGQVEDRMALAESLLLAGEHFLARTQWMQLAEEGHAGAIQRLARFFREQRGGRGLTGLYERVYMKTRAQADLIQLGEIYAEQGLLRLATSIAQLTGTSRPPAQAPWQELRRVDHFKTGNLLINPVSQIRSSVFGVPQGEYLTLVVDGPARLRTELRPIHKTGGKALSGGASLRLDGGLLWIPFVANQPSRTRTVNAINNDRHPGVPVLQEIELGPGTHRIVLQADTHSLLARFWRQSDHEQPPFIAGDQPSDKARLALLAGTADMGQIEQLKADLSLLSDGERALLFRVTGDLAGATAAGDWLTALMLALAAGDPSSIPEPRSADEAVLALNGLLYLKGNDRRRMVKGAAIAARWPQHERLAQLSRQLARGTRWQSLRTVDASAGIRNQAAATANQALRLRESLIPQRPGDTLIRGNNQESFRLFAPRSQKLDLQLAVEAVPGVTAVPVSVTLDLDGSGETSLVLKPGQGVHKLSLDLAAGAQELTVRTEDAVYNQFLVVRLDPSLLRPETQTWFVATADQPVVIKTFEPTWLRVESIGTQGSSIDYRYLDSPSETLVFKPREGASSTLYRFAKRVKMNRVEADARNIRFSIPESLPLANLSVDLRQMNWTPSPSFETPSSTWAFEMRTRDRTLGEDEDGATLADRYTEGLVTWRGQPLPGFTRVRFHWRERSQDRRTLGVVGAHSYLDRSGNFWQVLATAYQQDLPLADETPWSAFLRLRWSRDFDLGARVRHRPEVELFGRHLSIDEAPDGLADPIDLDVFSNYKANHQSGLRLKETLNWQPYADSWFSSTLRADLNEGFDSLDRASLDVDWSQMLGPIQATLFSSYRHFYADDDRRRSADRLRYGADLAWSLQRAGATRWETRLRWRANDDGDTDWSLALAYIFGDRGDFARYGPREVLFRNLKTQRHLQEGDVL